MSGSSHSPIIRHGDELEPRFQLPKTRYPNWSTFVFLVLAACDRKPPPVPRDEVSLDSAESEAPAPIVEKPAFELARAAGTVRAGVAAGRASLLDRPILSASRDDLNRLYDTETYAPLWVEVSGRPSRAARDAIAALRTAAEDGLDPLDYSGARLDSAVTALDARTELDPEAVGRFDLALSTAFLRYVRHLHNGRIDPRKLGFQLEVPVDRHDIAMLVHTALADGTVGELVADQRPPLAVYRRVKEALARYRLLADSVTDPVPPVKAPVKPDNDWEGTAPLALRLRMLGDLQDSAAVPRPADSTPVDSTPGARATRYGEPLVEAVKRFQQRHGLAPDGVIGPATVAALNVSIRRRADQLLLTLERLRWLPDLSGGRFMVVNIPTFHVWGWDSLSPEGTPSIDMNVIVGKNALSTRTPVFAEELEYVIFRPYWNVPPGILRAEVLPAIRKDPAYLTRNDMEIVQGQADDAKPVAATPENLALLTRGLLRVRQRPGPRNSLGLVKFMLPNAENVYLHSTPAQELFSRARRDFSHGCVRVERPVDLAVWVLRDVAGWDRARVVAAMERGKPTRVNLPRSLPVILFYTTAIVELDGRPGFYEDLYGHDQRLLEALGARSE